LVFFSLNQLSSILVLKNFYVLLVDDEDGSDYQTYFEFSTNHGEHHMLTNAVVAFEEINYIWLTIINSGNMDYEITVDGIIWLMGSWLMGSCLVG
jgi:hypothetical protein